MTAADKMADAMADTTTTADPDRERTALPVDPAELIELVRPLVVVVSGTGTVLQAHGGTGEFLGHRVANLVGRNVLELVPPDEQADVATYFVDLATQPVNSTRLPIPFRSSVVAADGSVETVDVIPTSLPPRLGVNGWAVVLVPLSLESGASRSLDAELSGAGRLEVKQLLTEELELSNGEWLTRWFLVDLPDHGDPVVIGSRSGDFGLGEPICAAFAAGWRPWSSAEDEVERLIDPADVPEPLRTAAVDGGWDIVGASRIVSEGRVVAALVRMGRSLDGDPTVAVRTNVVSRIRALLDVTTLLYGRWRERDRLLAAASTDPLTGLANRDTFHDAFAASRGRAAIVYVDVDRFKDVNDRWGHDVGDRVLVEIAERISHACRPGDLVARMGGDEFVVLLVDVEPTAAEAVGRRILAEVARPLGLDAGPDSVSVSIGLAASGTGDDVVALADRAMLTAKREGRARLVTA